MSPRARVAITLAAIAAAAPEAVPAQHPDDTPLAAQGPAQVSIHATEVDPRRISVLVGDAVQWRNVSTREHTITSRDGLFGSDRIGPIRTFTHTFTATGSFAYYCRIHPSITGAVDVSRVLLRAAAGPLVSGDEVTLTGRTAAGGGPITIERDPGGGFAAVATASPAADGTFSARLTADMTADYRAVAGGDVSAPVRVEVAKARTLTVVAVRGRRPRVRVVVAPALPGGSVLLQRFVKERFGWWTVRRARLVDGGRATFTLRPGARGPLRIVLTKPDGETTVTVSRIVRLR